MGLYDNTENMPPQIAERVEAGRGCGSYILNGWMDIIVQLDKDIAAIDPGYKIDQIKEKFGALRYYTSLSSGLSTEDREHICQLCEDAYAKTDVTCDVCGAPGIKANMSKGYIATRCEEHKE